MTRRFLFGMLGASAGVIITSTLKLSAQSPQGAQKFEQLVKDLKLTPQQKMQLVPILEAEAPKVQAIKGNPSLSRIQKMEQLKAVHDQSDPQVKSILSPEQYEKLQEVRQKDIQKAIKSKEHQ